MPNKGHDRTQAYDFSNNTNPYSNRTTTNKYNKHEKLNPSNLSPRLRKILDRLRAIAITS